jgi:hypothetical protein
VPKITSTSAGPGPHGQDGVGKTIADFEGRTIPDIRMGAGRHPNVVLVKRMIKEVSLKKLPLIVTNSEPKVEPERGTMVRRS